MAQGADTVTSNYVQFWFRRFRSGIFGVKVAPRTGKHVVENVDKITEIIEVYRHVSSRSIAQELKIEHKTVLNHLRKAGLKQKLNVWVPHQLRPKNMMDRISICKALAKQSGCGSRVGLELGDQRPSQLLTRMHSPTGDNVGEPLLKSLWLGRLPNGTQKILPALNENLDQLATVADKINDLTFSQ
ncbi:histone-lysine N-methyltransferase SETMAR [Trichonephila clavipes]|nr:histone-lysine N-methyltransferase SETMAR [Trichonephila clavipes]